MAHETVKMIIFQLIVTDKVVFGAIYSPYVIYTKTIIIIVLVSMDLKMFKPV